MRVVELFNLTNDCLKLGFYLLNHGWYWSFDVGLFSTCRL